MADAAAQLEALAKQTILLARTMHGPNADAMLQQAGILPVPIAVQGEETAPTHETQPVLQPMTEQAGPSAQIQRAQSVKMQAGPSAPNQSENSRRVKPFMLRFDPSLVGTPNDDLENHVEGQDPYWTTIGKEI